MQKEESTGNSEPKKKKRRKLWLWLIPCYIIVSLSVLAYLLLSPLPPLNKPVPPLRDIVSLGNIHKRLRGAIKVRGKNLLRPIMLRLTPAELNAILRGMVTAAITSSYSNDISPEQLLPITRGKIIYDAGNVFFNLPVFDTKIPIPKIGRVIKIRGIAEIKIDKHKFECRLSKVKIGRISLPDKYVNDWMQKYLPQINDDPDVKNLLKAIYSLSYDDYGNATVYFFPDRLRFLRFL